jgi:HEAT repeat protein
MKRVLVLACLFITFLEARAQAPDPMPKLLKQLKSRKADTRTAALMALGELGPKAEAAIPALAGILPGVEEEERLLATLALGKIGKASLPAVEKLLDHEDETVRFYAVWTLSIIGKDAQALTPRLLRMFAKDEDEEVRVKSAYALARVAPDSKDVLAAFANLATKKQIYSPERMAAIDELRRFGADGIKPLAQAMQDNGVATQAAESFGQLLENNKNDAFASAVLPFVPEILNVPTLPGAEVFTGNGLTFVLSKYGAELLPGLEKKLADKNPKTQSQALAALAQVSSKLVSHVENPALVKKIVKLLQPQFKSPAAATRLILAMQAPLTDDTQPAFEELLLDDDLFVRQQAHARFQQQGLDPAPALRTRMKAAKGDERIRFACALHSLTRDLELQNLLWENLRHKDAAVRHRIACQLAADQFPVEDANKAKKAVLPVLLESLKCEKAERRVQAVQALSAIPTLLSDHAQAILDRLDDPSPQVRFALLNVLPAIAKTDPKRSLKLMESLLGDEDMNVRQAVIAVLSNLGKEGVPLLVQMAQMDNDAVVSAMACEQLGAMGKDAESAAPALLQLAEDEGRGRDATYALAKIAPERSFPKLLDLLKKRDETLRTTIAYPPAVYENSSKLTAALVKDWKKSDLAQGRAIAHTLLKIQPLLPEKQHNALVFAASPVLSQQLVKVQKALKVKEAKERRDAVALLGQLRAVHALQPTNIDPVGKEWTAFQPRIGPQAALIDELFVQARRDSDLQVRRQARKAQTAEVSPGMPLGFGYPFLPGGFGRGARPGELVLP